MLMPLPSGCSNCCSSLFFFRHQNLHTFQIRHKNKTQETLTDSEAGWSTIQYLPSEFSHQSCWVRRFRLGCNNQCHLPAKPWWAKTGNSNNCHFQFSFQHDSVEVWKEQFAPAALPGRAVRHGNSGRSLADKSSKCLHNPNLQHPQTLALWQLLCISTGQAPTWSKAGLESRKVAKRWLLLGWGIPQLHLSQPAEPLLRLRCTQQSIRDGHGDKGRSRLPLAQLLHHKTVPSPGCPQAQNKEEKKHQTPHNPKTQPQTPHTTTSSRKLHSRGDLRA